MSRSIHRLKEPNVWVVYRMPFSCFVAWFTWVFGNIYAIRDMRKEKKKKWMNVCQSRSIKWKVVFRSFFRCCLFQSLNLLVFRLRKWWFECMLMLNLSIWQMKLISKCCLYRQIIIIMPIIKRNNKMKEMKTFPMTEMKIRKSKCSSKRKIFGFPANHQLLSR